MRLLVVLALVGCGKDAANSTGTSVVCVPEIPYDGIDNDCVDGDVIDIDGDTFPGIDKDEYLAAFPGATWPSSVQDGPVDCADDPAVWPEADEIFPGSVNDPPYDGLDSDCGADNDFDFDQDGYIAEGYDAAFAAYVTDWGYDHLVSLGTDCDDFDADVNPGVPPELDAWYDGVDSDCAGNNDFDADADGFDVYSDCLDQPDPTMSVYADPALVYPGAVDVPYDGIDSDCQCDNDFDVDLDGFMPDDAQTGAFGATFTDYVDDWGCTLGEAYGDCDDYDPQAPSLEVLGDAADSDCDGNPDGTPFAFGTSLWDTPRPPRLARTTGHYVLATAADWVDVTGIAPASADEEQGILLPFDPAAGVSAAPVGSPMVWLGAATPLPIGGTIDVEAFGADVVGAASYQFPGSSGYLAAKVLEHNIATGSYIAISTEWGIFAESYTATGVDLTLDVVGHPWAVSCADGILQVIRGDANSANATQSAAEGPSITNPAGPPSGVCFWNAAPVPSYSPPTYGGSGEVVACQPGIDCTTYDFDAFNETLTPAASNPWAGRQLEYGQFREGWHILLETGQPGVLLEGPSGPLDLLPDWTVHATDAHWRDTNGVPGADEVYVAAIAEPIPDDGLGKRVVVAYGPIGGPYAEAELPFEHPTRPDLELDGVGIVADANRLFIGVSALATVIDPADCYPAGTYPVSHDYCLSDVVGWVFFGW